MLRTSLSKLMPHTSHKLEHRVLTRNISSSPLTNWGTRRISALGGAVKVKNELKIDLVIRPKPQKPLSGHERDRCNLSRHPESEWKN